IVTETYYNYSKVRSIIDTISSVSAMNTKNYDICIVNGSLQLMDQGLLEVEFITMDSDAAVGDEIVTSYISSKYFPGIKIGYLTEITNDNNNLTKTAKLTPVVDFEHLTEVLVITELKEDMMQEEGN
ncbi:MAG: rod shape-determining protein MreC, partial [Lachnospiraceae bacterium]|nr:rod shape-determining protein MreC [Lachnospiraceae bacterium]